MHGENRRHISQGHQQMLGAMKQIGIGDEFIEGEAQTLG